MTGIIAALMIAGSLSAISGATAVPSHNNMVIVGEGSSPVPLAPPCDGPRGGDGSPLINQ